MISDKEEKAYKSYLESIGDSIVVVADDEIVKTHVHTNDPGLAIQKALTFGALSRIKIDNMREEHQEKLLKDRFLQFYLFLCSIPWFPNQKAPKDVPILYSYSRLF